MNPAEISATAERAVATGQVGSASVNATAGESEGIIGLRERCGSLSFSAFSCHGLSTSARARAFSVACAVAPAGVCLGSSSSAMSAAVVHAHASTLHFARNSGGTGGLLPVQRSTSHCLGLPRGGRVPKVGGPDRPKNCSLSQRWEQG